MNATHLTPTNEADLLIEKLGVELARDGVEQIALDRLADELEQVLAMKEPLVFDRRTGSMLITYVARRRAKLRREAEPGYDFDRPGSHRQPPVEPVRVREGDGGVKFYPRPARTGAVVVEFALILPVMLTIILGGIDLGLMSHRKSAAAHAASVAAVSLTAGTSNPSVQADLNPYLQSISGTMQIEGGSVTVTVPNKNIFLPGPTELVVIRPYIQPGV